MLRLFLLKFTPVVASENFCREVAQSARGGAGMGEVCHVAKNARGWQNGAERGIFGPRPPATLRRQPNSYAGACAPQI